TATNFAELSERHAISVVGNIPTSFPPPSLPRFDLIPAITIDALSIAAIAVAVHATVAKIVEKRYEYGIKCGQELYALGFVGVLSSLLPVFPVTSGFARSVIGVAVGGSTQVSQELYALGFVGVLSSLFPVFPVTSGFARSVIGVAVGGSTQVSQELYALGFVGVLSSLFPVFPVTSGFARSVIGVAVGGSTQLTSLFSALALLSVILYIGPALEYLPKCVLASMVMVTMKAYVKKFTELRKLWPMFKIDFLIWIASMLLTICYDMAEGLALAIAFAILTTIFRNQWFTL
uniref:Sulfate_transp domain-containing protein n=1 Tax=Ascaris lumbricoides TaxID=6252 RepID=A0A0M3ITK9_ASCLU